MDIQGIYRHRFSDSSFRIKMWEVLCRDFFQQFISPSATVLEVACGHCEFINQIEAQRKIGLDINPDAKHHANKDVEIVLSPSTEMDMPDASIDVVFMSNFLEHITRTEIDQTLKEAYRILRPGGQLIILQPNIRFLAADYWMFIDHITPVDDRALLELLAVIGFSERLSKPRFLPYTTQSRLPNSTRLLKLYLRLPMAQRLFGKQSLIRAIK